MITKELFDELKELYMMQLHAIQMLEQFIEKQFELSCNQQNSPCNTLHKEEE